MESDSCALPAYTRAGHPRVLFAYAHKLGKQARGTQFFDIPRHTAGATGKACLVYGSIGQPHHALCVPWSFSQGMKLPARLPAHTLVLKRRPDCFRHLCRKSGGPPVTAPLPRHGWPCALQQRQGPSCSMTTLPDRSHLPHRPARVRERLTPCRTCPVTGVTCSSRPGTPHAP